MSRIDRSPVSTWWWSIDHITFFLLCVLATSGLIFLIGGSPAVAERLGYTTYHFVTRQIIFIIPSFILILIISTLSLRLVRRFALLLYFLSYTLILIALEFGPLIKGAHRWIVVAGTSIQPSEFIKPSFVVLVSWAFAEASRRKDMPGALIAFLLLPLTIVPLILQPDFGQTVLITTVWCTLFFIAGLHWIWIGGLGGAGIIGILAAYSFLPHVTARIDSFLGKTTDVMFQVKASLDAIKNGHWYGQGLGEGTVKRYLPDAHTDFIFSVIAEEFGIFVCIGIVFLFALIILRNLYLARNSMNSFSRLAITGLITMFGLQASINMMVSVKLVPPKGMTLPFISYGGSSLLSLAITMGFILALTRKRFTIEND